MKLDTLLAITNKPASLFALTTPNYDTLLSNCGKLAELAAANTGKCIAIQVQDNKQFIFVTHLFLYNRIISVQIASIRIRVHHK